MDQEPQLAGPIYAVDVAIFASYYSRALNLGNALEEAVQFVAGNLYRPAGSAVGGVAKKVGFQVPRSSLGPTLLLPLVQAADTLDDEGILFGLDDPVPILFTGAARGCVFWASYNNVTQYAGIDMVRRTHGPLHNRLRMHLRRFTSRSIAGSAAALTAVSLAAELGWEESYCPHWLQISTPETALLNGLHPVEMEEAIPFIDALPSSSAVLGLFKPCRLTTVPHSEAFMKVGNIAGRVGLSDGHYSLMAIGARPEFYLAEIGRTWPAQPKQYTTRLSYRGAPTDGQFSSLIMDDTQLHVLFKIPTHTGIVAAMRSHEARGTWTWTYEWYVPFSQTDVLAQYIDAGPATLLPPEFTAAAAAQEATVVVPMPPPKPQLPPGPMGDANMLREYIGEAWGQILDNYQAMKALAGREMATNRYETTARALAGAVTGFEAETAALIIPPEQHPAMWTHLYNMAYDAAHWTPSPGMKNDCLRMASFALSNISMEAFQAPPPDIEVHEEPEPPSAQAVEEQILAAAVGQAPGTAGESKNGQAGPSAEQLATAPAAHELQQPGSGEDTSQHMTSPAAATGESSGTVSTTDAPQAPYQIQSVGFEAL